MALGGEVVDLVGPHLGHDAQQAAGIGHVAVVQRERQAGLVRLVEEMIDAVGIEQRRPPLDAVDRVALAQQELGEIGAVLPGNAGDQRDFCHR